MILGPVGMAAAAAIATARRRKRPHSFETNPSVRRRQQTRLLRYDMFLTIVYIIWSKNISRLVMVHLRTVQKCGSKDCLIITVFITKS